MSNLRNTLYRKTTRSSRRMTPSRRLLYKLAAPLGLGIIKLWLRTCRVVRVVGVENLQTALAHKGGPVVVDVVVDPYALARPAHVPAASARGFTLSMARQALHGQMDDVIATAEHNVRLL